MSQYNRAALNVTKPNIIGRDHLPVCCIGDSCCLSARFKVFADQRDGNDPWCWEPDHTGTNCCVNHFREFVKQNPSLLVEVIDQMAEALEKRMLL